MACATVLCFLWQGCQETPLPPALQLLRFCLLHVQARQVGCAPASASQQARQSKVEEIRACCSECRWLSCCSYLAGCGILPLCRGAVARATFEAPKVVHLYFCSLWCFAPSVLHGTIWWPLHTITIACAGPWSRQWQGLVASAR